MMKRLLIFGLFLGLFMAMSNASALSTIVQFTEFEGSWYSFLRGQDWNCSEVAMIYGNVNNYKGWSNCPLNQTAANCNASAQGCTYCYNYLIGYTKYLDDIYCGAGYIPPSNKYTTCRNCDDSNISVFQIWYNNTGTCSQVTDVLTAFKNENRSISMVSLDTDVCSNTGTVPAVSSDYTLRGNIPTTSIWSPSDYTCGTDVFIIYPDNGSGWSVCNLQNAVGTCDRDAQGCVTCCNIGAGYYIDDQYGCNCNDPPVGDLKKARLIYYNSSSGDESNLYLTSGDALGLNLRFDTTANHTKILNRNNGQVATNGDTYVINFTASGSRIQFFIANKNAKTIWADEVIVENTLKWGYLSNLEAIYTTHGQQVIDITATYNPSTDMITITPVGTNQRIPIERATGSNSLFITGSFISAFFTTVVVGLGFSIAGILALVTLFFGIGAGVTEPKDYVKVVLGAVIIFTILVTIMASII